MPIYTGDPYGGPVIPDFIRSMLEKLGKAGLGISGNQPTPPVAPTPTPAPSYGSTKMGPDLTPPASPTPAVPRAPYPAPGAGPYPLPGMGDFNARLDALMKGQRPMGSEPSAAPAPSPSISFAWGGGTPEAYTPGQTDIARAAGAPPSDTFMGRTTRPGMGTLSVLNPPAVKSEDELADEYIRNRMQRNIQDPFWEEREKAQIWREAQIGAQSGLYDLRAKQIQRWAQDQKTAIDNEPNTSPEVKAKSKAGIDSAMNQMLNDLYGGQGEVKSPGNFPRI